MGDVGIVVALGGVMMGRRQRGSFLRASDVLILDLGSGYTSVFGLQRCIDCVLFCMYIILQERVLNYI